MSEDAIAKWDKAAACLDLQARGEHLRYGVFKQSLFSKARGKTLLVAAGTGIDFKYFPEGIDLTAIDFSPKMLERARLKAKELKGTLTLKEADVTNLDFEDGSFDTVVTSCTFCSVPEPVKGLEELRRVLKDDGRLLMFEHVRSANWYFGAVMDLMNPISSMLGPNINRRTADNVRKAGFRLTREYNVYLDMVKLFEAVKAG
jgi:ubiquinone/menaquinone biosynthesis C-methylase UbiE